ncbi:MAG: hypothetical protein MUF84_18920 [Anaerolineae bacterium]|nr:hypothetical protein [Anaerolineae bacterium]
MRTPYLYSVFGLNLALPVPLPFLRPAFEDETPDAVAEMAPVPRRLESPVLGPSHLPSGWEWSVDHAGNMLLVTQSARYLASGGDRITVDPETEPVAVVWLMQFAVLCVLPALLIQRGLLTLHGNTVSGPAGAVTLIGDSGTGKSTLTAALLARGYQLVSDDVTALGLDETGEVDARPGFPMFKLDATTRALLGAPTDACWPMADGRNKVAYRIPLGSFAADDSRLRAIYSLAEPAGDHLVVAPVTGSAKLSLLLGQAYLAPLVQLRAHALAALPRLLKAVPTYEVRRPQGLWTTEDLADKVIQHVRG